MSFFRAAHAEHPFFPRHASADEWEAFVATYANNKQYRWELLRFRRQFVERYPDLNKWFAAPLLERVGRSFDERQERIRHNAFCKASYQARSYLVFLATQGYAQFDWDWLLAIYQLRFGKLFTHLAGDKSFNSLIDDASRLGFQGAKTRTTFEGMIYRLIMHTADPCIEHITDVHLAEMTEAFHRFAERPDVALFYGSVEHYREKLKDYLSYLHQFHVVLYHRGQVKAEPQTSVYRVHLRVFTIQRNVQMQQLLDRYLATRHLTDRPSTIKGLESVVRQFIVWLEQMYPDVDTFSQVTREMVLTYIETLQSKVGAVTKRPLTVGSKRNTVGKLFQFFREISQWGWEDAPRRSLLQGSDIPKLPQRIPRYIPDNELERLMVAIRTLECPFQKAALLIARWSGARRGEIRRLAVDCQDSYPDGTPRLHIPVGKTYKERLVPIHEEAADAIRTLQVLRKGERGFSDSTTGIVTRYLFLQQGTLLSATYLFATSLQNVCNTAGLVTSDGKPTISAHRFRHTVGTQLAERGARLHTVMKVLGHDSAQMALVYAQISDKEVLKDYQSALGPGVTLAGPSAEKLRSGELSSSAVDWLKSNFFKTELELGRCLRLPQEGACECELYLTCAKFVTTPEYAPRLRRRIQRERDLVEDATTHGWQREIERHQCTIRRLEQLLTDLGETVDGPVATD